ncbi:unnamed protein product [Clonostachys rosea]|uniref:WH1 domain-containing protein n=1 Tax=Bionectria ochroleuca TaxID=29856 RepID=A0ABY6URE6_BIOOC|nr:unnamed protein product [Clonostachys rosea]
MPSILTDAEKDIVKSVIRKTTNKIFAVGLIRLYVAWPDPKKWTYTGLEGALVLLNDLSPPCAVWLRIVDISPAARGVIWEMQVPEEWRYSATKPLLHTFEMDRRVYGCSFADEKEARMFLRKMEGREQLVCKKSKSTPFLSYAGDSRFSILDAYDSNWRPNFGDELRKMGLSDESIHENQDFIVSYLKEQESKARS